MIGVLLDDGAERFIGGRLGSPQIVDKGSGRTILVQRIACEVQGLYLEC